MKARSIRFRLTVWYAGVLASVLILFCAAIYAGLNHFLRSNLRESVVKDAQEVGSIVGENANEGDDAIRREVGEHFSAGSNDRVVRVLKPDGTQLYLSNSDESQLFPPLNISSVGERGSDMVYRADSG